MATKIEVQDLQPGMVVFDTGMSWLNDPKLYSSPGVISSFDEVARILSQGYRYAFIDGGDATPPALNADNTNGKRSAPIGKNTNQDEALVEAFKLHTEYMTFSKTIIKSVTEGRAIEYGELASLVDSTIVTLSTSMSALLAVAMIRTHDPYTYTHSVNASIYSIAFGKHIDMTGDQLRDVGIAAMLHDVGKITLPPNIIGKPGKLTPEEYVLVKTHPTAGIPWLKKVKGISDDIITGVSCHHEKYDGNGYPHGLRGSEIHLFSRIISIADVYDALTSKRSYRDKISPHAALKVMYGMRGKAFFPGLVEKFIKCVGVYPTGCIVKSDDGKTGIVTQQNSEHPTKPKIVVLLDEDGNECEPFKIDLSAERGDGQPHSIVECMSTENIRFDIEQRLNTLPC